MESQGSRKLLPFTAPVPRPSKVRRWVSTPRATTLIPRTHTHTHSLESESEREANTDEGWQGVVTVA